MSLDSDDRTELVFFPFLCVQTCVPIQIRVTRTSPNASHGACCVNSKIVWNRNCYKNYIDYAVWKLDLNQILKMHITNDKGQFKTKATFLILLYIYIQDSSPFIIERRVNFTFQTDCGKIRMRRKVVTIQS